MDPQRDWIGRPLFGLGAVLGGVSPVSSRSGLENWCYIKKMVALRVTQVLAYDAVKADIPQRLETADLGKAVVS